MMRWSLGWRQVLPRLLLVIVTLWGTQYVLGLAARRIAIRTANATLSANVEVASASVSLLDRQIRFDKLRVANPRCLSEMLFEADCCELDLAVTPLLRKRAVVDSGRVTGIRFAPPLSNGMKSDWLGGDADGAARKWLAHLSERFHGASVEQFRSVQLAAAVCARWPEVRAAWNQRADELTARAAELQHAATDAESNRLRHAEFFAALPGKTSALEREFDEFDRQIGQFASSFEAQRRAIVAARQDDERTIGERLRLDPLDGESLTVYLFRNQLCGPLDELIGWLRWARRVVPSSPTSRQPKRGEEVLFAGCRPAPNFLIRELQLQGEARVGGRAFELSGLVAGVTNDPRCHGKPLDVRLTSTGSQPLDVRATIDRTGSVARDELLIDCRDIVLPEYRLGRSEELELRLCPSTAAVSISLAVEGEKLSGDIQIVQKEVKLEPELNGDLREAPLDEPVHRALSSLNRVATRLTLQGTLEAPSCTLWSNLGPALAEAMDRAADTAGGERANSLLAEARRQVDEQLAALERRIAEEQARLAAQLNGAAAEVERIAARQTTVERVSVEQLGGRLPKGSLFR
jgi:hypothetical protein